MKIYDKIISKIKEYDKILIGGHKWLDLDALGACVTTFTLCTYLNKNASIIRIDEKEEKGIEKIFKDIDNKYPEIIFKYEKDLEKFDFDKTLLIMCDVNNKELFCVTDIVKKCDVIIIDHHVINEMTLNDTVCSLISTDHSSTCELLFDILDYNNVPINSFVASLMLSGIIVDTNNFNIRVGSNTFYCSARLMEFGGSLKLSWHLFKEDLDDYKRRQSLIFNAKLYKDVAITFSDTNIFKKEELSKCAEELVNFEGIEASYAIAKINHNTVAISARSRQNKDVFKIIGIFGGGGHINAAAVQLKYVEVKDIRNKLINLIMER
ncbi:MAG: DHH family phosphoesterase [Bacilli bacterium]